MQVTIRRAGPLDAAAFAELFLLARRAGATAGTIPPLVHDDDDVRGWIRDFLIPRLECWVAESASGSVIGNVVLDGDWINQLYVHPDLTGAGVGAQLVDVAKQERSAGLRLWTFVSNEGAQRFYLRHGFLENDRTDGSDNEEGAPAIQYGWRPDDRLAGRHHRDPASR